jgi:hypothetical protein
MAKAAFEISESDQADGDFISLPFTLYEGEMMWRAPLRFERKAQLSAKNLTRTGISARFFVARHDGQAIGRIAAFTNAAHDSVYGGCTAFFGYFDCADDPELADALLNSAKTWARAQGRTHLRGPAMWSVNEEVGLLVEGFDHPPAVMMPYGHPYYVDAITRNGFEKSIDLYAYLADLTDGAPSGRLVEALRQKAENDSGLTWRSMNRRDFMGDVRLARDIFNDAWSGNWGFIPFSEEQFGHMAKEMRPIMFAQGFQIGFVDDEPAAFIWMIPDLNEAFKGLDGRLLPVGWAKLMWRLKAKKVTKGRVPLMGLKRKFHKGRRGVALTTKICSDAFDAGKAQGFTQCELSWILEGNRSMTGICEMVGAEQYKTYRMVEAEL